MENYLYSNLLDKIYLKIETAYMILKRGGYILIRDNRGQAALMKAAEFADLNDHLCEIPKNEILCLTTSHLKSFGKSFVLSCP